MTVKVDKHEQLTMAAATVTPGKSVRPGHLTVLAVWTGTPTGLFTIEVSFDGGTTWDVAPDLTPVFTTNSKTQPAGAAGRRIWTFPTVPGGAWRIAYAGTAGTLLDVWYAWGQ